MSLASPAIVVGVLPPGFSFDYPTLGSPEPADIYVPFPMSDAYAFESGRSGRVDHVRILGIRTNMSTGESIHPSRRVVSGSDFSHRRS